MKLITYALMASIVAVLLFGIYRVAQTTLTAKPDNRLGSIVRLVRNDHTFCTGIVVTDQTIITASHCVIVQTPFGGVINNEPIEIRDDSNISVGASAKPYNVRIQLDQAVLTGDFTQFRHRKTLTSIKELNKLAQQHIHMLSCGYPLGGDLHCSDLYFKNLYDFMWAASGLLLPGMSGGPVMLEDGTVVAVNVAVTGDKSLVSPIYNMQMLYKEK